MNKPTHPRYRPQLLLLLGCIAVLIQLWAGTRLMAMQPATVDSQGNFVAAICTTVGNNQALPASASLITSNSQKDSPDPSASTHDCCSFCVTSSSTLLSMAFGAVSPAPTLRTLPLPPAASRLFIFAAVTPPLRGPPLIA
ncbi:MAG: DUF2946 family protein [Rhodocyclales bacterium]|nr:DUF2946 family protein [Rhodocyclales bacterium]